MKNKAFSIIFALIIVAAISLPVFAAADDSEAQLNYVTDAAGLLTQTEAASLEEIAAAISSEHECSIYIVTVDDYVNYTEYDKGILDCAEEIFDDYDLGYGEDETGLLLLLSMSDRDYALAAHGDKAHGAFTDYGKYALADEFLDNLGEDDWYGGFSDYLSAAADFLVLYEEGTPVDVNAEGYDEQYSEYFNKDYGGLPLIVKLLLTIVLPIVIAFIVVMIFKGRMKSVFRAGSAARYVDEGSLVIEDEWDRFSHVTEVIIPKPETDGGGHGGGTTIGSGGFSGHSGKF